MGLVICEPLCVSLVFLVLRIEVSLNQVYLNHNTHICVGFEALTAVSAKMAVFWVVALCSLVVNVYQTFVIIQKVHNLVIIVLFIFYLSQVTRSTLKTDSVSHKSLEDVLSY
jgi:hypothetical protein